MKIGVDFDNTLINYDELMYDVALRRNLVSNSTPRSKKGIRDEIRLLPNGEIEWQKVQGEVYGPRIMDARLIDGVMDFFSFCKTHEIKIHIVSHKTEYARYDETRTNLRKNAMDWMRANSFFDKKKSPLIHQDIFFESTRHEKIIRISSLGCTHFVDDLEETFLEDSFPDEVVKILYNPHVGKTCCKKVTLATSWQDILTYLNS
ncbi:MAG: hypothetical protein ACLQT6_04085 [Desulfomonilaceae bacterium]